MQGVVRITMAMKLGGGDVGNGFKKIKPQSTMELKLIGMGYRMGGVFFKGSEMWKRYVRGKHWINVCNGNEVNGK